MSVPIRRMLSLIRRAGPSVERAWVRTIRLNATRADIQLLENALGTARFDLVLDMLGFTPEGFAPLSSEITDNYRRFGGIIADSFRQIDRVAPRRSFDHMTPEAIRYIEQNHLDTVRLLRDDADNALQYVLVDGTARNQTRQEMALRVAGRINRRTGFREGGLVWLNRPQMDWVESLEAQLNDGSERALKHVLTRANLSDGNKRVIWDAILDQRPLTQEEIAKIVIGYTNRSHLQRGKTIADTELHWAWEAAAEEAVRQRLARGGDLEGRSVLKVWNAKLDEKTRDSHVSMHGETVPFGLPFIVGGSQIRREDLGQDGPRLPIDDPARRRETEVTGGGYPAQAPGDWSLPPQERINCRCSVRYVDGLSGKSI